MPGSIVSAPTVLKCALGPFGLCDPKVTLASNHRTMERFSLADRPKWVILHLPNHGRFLLQLSPACRGFFLGRFLLADFLARRSAGRLASRDRRHHALLSAAMK